MLGMFFIRGVFWKRKNLGDDPPHIHFMHVPENKQYAQPDPRQNALNMKFTKRVQQPWRGKPYESILYDCDEKEALGVFKE